MRLAKVVSTLFIIICIILVAIGISNSLKPASFKVYESIAGVEDTRKACSTPLPFVEYDCMVQVFIGPNATRNSVLEIIESFYSREDPEKIVALSIRYKSDINQAIGDNTIVSTKIAKDSASTRVLVETFLKALEDKTHRISLKPFGDSYSVALLQETTSERSDCELIDKYNLSSVNSVDTGFITVNKSITDRRRAKDLCISIANANIPSLRGWLTLTVSENSGPQKGKDIISVDNADRSVNSFDEKQSAVLELVKPYAKTYNYPVLYRVSDKSYYL